MLVLQESCPTKVLFFLQMARWNSVPFNRFSWAIWRSFHPPPPPQKKKKNHDDLNDTRFGNHGIFKHKIARKQSSGTSLVRTQPLRAVKKSFQPSSFLWIAYQSLNALHGSWSKRLFAFTMITEWACSVGLKMAKAMKTLWTWGSKSTVSVQYRSTELDTRRRRSCEGRLCAIVTVGYGARMKDVLGYCAKCERLLFFLKLMKMSSIRSKIGCYSARRGAAFHCIAGEMFVHRRKNNRWVWEFFVIYWPGLALIFQEKAWTKRHQSQLAWSFVERDSSGEEAMCWHSPFFFVLLSILVRPWRWPIWRILTGISPYVSCY